MTDLWGLGEGVIPFSGNWQVRGVPNPEQQDFIDAGGQLASLWYGPMAQEPYRSSINLDDMHSVMDRWNTFLPEMAAIRMPFNINFWGTYGTIYHGTEFYRETTTKFFQAAHDRGVKFHWCLMDGPSQRADDEGDGPAYPTNKTQANILSWCDLLSQRQVLSHQKLLDHYAAHPDELPEAWAFEFINEPDVYNRIGRDLGDIRHAYAIMAQHNVNIWQQVYANAPAEFDNAWLFVGGFNYSARFEGLAQPNPFLPGGVSAIQYIRDNIPAARLCWSMHAYPGWIGGKDRHEYRRKLRSRMGGETPVGIEGDRVMITETNVRHDDVFGYPWIYAEGYAHYNNLQQAQWLAEMGIGISWWTGANYAQGRLIQIQGGSVGVRIDEGWTLAGFHYFAGFRNNPAYFTGQQNGIRPPTIDQNVQRWVSLTPGTDERDEFEAHGLIGNNAAVAGIGKLVRIHGGRGTCLLQGHGGAGNLLYGGDGWNVLKGGTAQCMDFLALGRGGGVCRSTDGLRAIFMGSTHTPSRLYLSPGKNSVCLFDNITNHHEIVVEPSSTFHSVIMGFNPDRDGEGNGDRISFRGHFTTAQDLRDAMSIEYPGHTNGGTQDLVEDLVIDLPGGGTIRFMSEFNLIHSLDQYCLDFTDGWYQEGWTEPPDYDEAELDQPAPPADSFTYDPLLFPEEAGGNAPLPGGQVPIFDRGGNAVVLRDRFGNEIPTSEFA